MAQKARPAKFANYKPDLKIASAPFQYDGSRTLTDKIWFVACIAGFVTFFALGGALKSSAKVSVHPSGLGSQTGSQYFETLGGSGTLVADEYATCMKENFNIDVSANNRRGRHLLAFGVPPHGDTRRLSAEDTKTLEHHKRILADTVESDWTIWDMFQDKIEIPIAIMLSCAAIGVVWVFLLRIAATPVVWATLIVKILLAIYVGSLCADAGAGGVAGFFYAVAAIATLWCIMNKPKIRMAADLIASSALALQKNPALFITCLMVYGPYLVYVAVWMIFVSTVPLVWEWRPDTYLLQDGPRGRGAVVKIETCQLDVQSWAKSAKNFLTFHFYFTTSLVAQIRLMTVAGTIGTWYFSNTSNKPLLVSMHWMKTALTTSLGTLSVGATIGAICDYIIHKASGWCWCLDPIKIMCRVIMCCLRTMIQALTRMCTVVHTITGAPFCACKDLTMAILRRNFVGGLATEAISGMVMWLASFVFASAMTFTTWFAYEKAYDNYDLLGPNTKPNSDNAEIYLWVFLVLFCVMNSVWTVFIIAMFIADWFKGCIGNCSDGGFPIIIPLASIFVGSVSHMVFNYILGIVSDSTSAMLICTAIDRDNGSTSHEPVEEVEKVLTATCLYASDDSGEASDSIARRNSKHVV